MTVAYDAAFYDLIRAGCQSSAAVVVPLVMDALSPFTVRTVVDVGCGEGWWAQAFAAAGCDVLGVDDADITSRPAGPRFVRHDLTASFGFLSYHDLAVSLEVAEHLPEWRAEGFVADLCMLSPVVLFSAAVPGQGGHGHIHEQWPDYWANLFNTHGYAVSAALRWAIWSHDRVEPWYRQNLLIAARYPDQYPDLFDTPLARVESVVHPAVFTGRLAG